MDYIYIYILDQVYTTLYQLTESEPDEELAEHYDYLCDGLQQTIKYIKDTQKEE